MTRNTDAIKASFNLARTAVKHVRRCNLLLQIGSYPDQILLTTADSLL